uniref:Epsin, N-terminal; ENTH/VHS n=1 Tax=Solanum tuberosum TaxID=4113 RepID=M0ZZZ0_SOLTU
MLPGAECHALIQVEHIVFEVLVLVMHQTYLVTIASLSCEMIGSFSETVVFFETVVLDATSNEPWGPHGSLLADIAQASRNYHEYQMIMSVVWKRINDTGKNWRHVYKTLSDFQYIDSSGRDQGSNVRKKSQSLVVLINDKERIQEVRQKAASNRDKFRNTSAGGMYRPGSQSGSGGYGDRFDEDRYGGRDEERNGYGREREWGDRDEDKNGRYGDSNSRDGDRYGRDYDDRSRDGNKDDDYRGRSQSTDDYNYGSRSRSSDRYRDHANDDDGQYSSRKWSYLFAKVYIFDSTVVSRPLERRFSEQNLSAPPSYEEAVGGSHSPTHSERDVETSSASAPKSSSPHASASPSPATVPAPAPATAPPPAPAAATASPPSPAAAPAPPPENTVAESFDEFDPRASFTAAAPPVPSNGPVSTTSGGEMDLLGSLCDPFSNALALVPAASSASEVNPSGTTGTETTFGEASSVSTGSNQMFEDPFGDGPFRAMTSNNMQTHLQNTTPSFHPNPNQSPELPQSAPQGAEVSNAAYSQFAPTNMHYAQQELSTSNQEIDILADILPPSGPSPPGDHAIPSVQPATQTGFESYGGPTTQQTGYMAPPGQAGALTVFAAQPGQQSPQTSFPIQGQTASPVGFSGQANNSPSYGGYPAQPGQASQTGFGPTGGQPTSGFQPAAGYFPQSGYQIPAGSSVQSNANAGGYNTGLGPTGPFGNQMGQTSAGQPYLSQPTGATHMPSQMHLQSSQIQTSNALVLTQTSPASTALVANTQPAKDKFETKSTVWADTLSRGLVNLNISGSKTNPLADIGVDFDAINRKERRMEKPSTAPVISTINMGKAMGSGTGVGRAGAGALRAPSNPMAGSGMGMGMGMGMGGMGMAGGGPAGGPGMGAYGGANQPYGGMGMNRPMNNMGMGMNMGQGFQMQQPSGFPPGPGAPMQGGYNPRMGMGPYGQQPYGGGYQ